MSIKENFVLNNILSGGIAGIINISLIYAPKTIIKYQYVNNTSIFNTLNELVFNNNDKLRIFRGLIPGIMKSSLGKMGDVGIYSYYIKKNNNNLYNSNLIEISSLTTLWRLNLMPFDTLSNTYQVHGKEAFNIMKNKVRKKNITVLYNGMMALSSINFISNYIWFGVFTKMNKELPKEINNDLRNGVIGFSSSLFCDLLVNPIRILKTYKQSHIKNISYIESLGEIMKNSNSKIQKYLFRGMKMRILLNSFSSSLYVILWKKIENTNIV